MTAQQIKGYLRVLIWGLIFVIALLAKKNFPSIPFRDYLLFLSVLGFCFIIDVYPGSQIPNLLVRTLDFIRQNSFRILLLLIIFDTVKIIYYKNQYHPFEPFLQAYPYKYNLPDKKDTNEIRILCMGGSTTSNSALKDTCKYPYRLERRLQEQFPSKKIRVLNLGMDWYTSKHLLINYVTEVKYYHPDVVICMEAINDLYRSFSPRRFSMGAYNDQYTHFYGPSIGGADPMTMEYFLLSRSRWGDIPLRFLTQEQVKYPVSEFRSIRPYILNLATFADYVRSDSVLFVLVTQPNLYKDSMSIDEQSICWFGREFCNRRKSWRKLQYPDVPSMKAAMDAFLYEEKKLAKAKNILLIDAEKQIPKTMDYFIDDVHYNERAADSLSSVISRALAVKIK